MEEAIQFSLLQKDKNGLDGRFISDFKGELNVLIEPIFFFIIIFILLLFSHTIVYIGVHNVKCVLITASSTLCVLT